MKQLRQTTLLLAIPLILIFPGTGMAQTLEVDSHQINPSGFQCRNIKLGEDAVSKIAVFHCQSPTDTVENVYYRRINADGRPIGDMVRVSNQSVLGSSARSPDISGDFIVYHQNHDNPAVPSSAIVYQISTSDNSCCTLNGVPVYQWVYGGAYPSIYDGSHVFTLHTTTSDSVSLEHLDELNVFHHLGTSPPGRPQIGSRFAVWYDAFTPEVGDIFAVDLNGPLFANQLTDTPDIHESSPTTSGPWVVFQVNTSPYKTVRAMNLDSGEERIVTDNGAFSTIDRGIVAYSKSTDGTYFHDLDIYAYRLSTGETFQVTDGLHPQQSAVTSDVLGNLLAYYTGFGDSYVLSLKRPDLLAAATFSGGIQRISGVTGEILGEFVSAGSGGLDFPFGMAFNTHDSHDLYLYVVSRENNRILRYHGNTGEFIDTFISDDGLNKPRRMVFGPDGAIYVISGDDSVRRYDGETGAFVDEFISPGSEGLDNAADLVFGPDGDLYISSTNTHSVLRFDGATGSYRDAISGGPLSYPKDLEKLGDHLLILNSGTGSVLEYDGDGTLVGTVIAGENFLTSGMAVGAEHVFAASSITDGIYSKNSSTGAFGTFASGFSLTSFSSLLEVPYAIAHCGLEEGGDGTIRDTCSGLTWLRDASYALTSGYDADGMMTWQDAMTWADNLDFGGYADWHLPSTLVPDPSCGNPAPDYVEGNCTGSEMGQLYYAALGNTAGFGGFSNSGPFINIGEDGSTASTFPFYWSATEIDADNAHHFLFDDGYTNPSGTDKSNVYFAWAVRDMLATDTPTGSDAEVRPSPGVTVTFANVSTGGETSVVVSTVNPGAGGTGFGFEFFGNFYDIDTAADYSDAPGVENVEICLTYSESDLPAGTIEENILVKRWNGTSWEDPISSTVDTANNVACGTFPGLSWFGIAVEVASIPGDLDADGDVDRDDLGVLLGYRNQPATASPECDLDGDGMITVLDARKLVTMCTRPRCAVE